MKLLLVSPEFQGYWQSIADAFDRVGYDVTTHRYDLVASRPRKAWNKLAHELPAKIRRDTALQQSRAAMTARAIAAVRATQPDVILVVRGDVLGMDFWEVAGRGSRVIMWLYDELRRMHGFEPASVAQYASLATYSRSDAEQLTASGIPTAHIRLGFDERRVPSARSDARGLVSFVGAPLRARTDALTRLQQEGLPVRAWGRGWSDHPVDRARTWRLHRSGIPNGRDVSYEDALAIMRDSAATLNIHGDQDGFTMRTFEACGVGGVQLIDRADVAEVYEPGAELLVFRDLDELADLARRAVHEPDDFAQMRERARLRTLADHTLVHRARQLEPLW